jgi:hypothetical protein
VAIGFLLSIGSLAWYQITAGGQSVVGKENIPVPEEIAYVTLCLFAAGLALTFAGLTRLLRSGTFQTTENGASSYLARLAWAIKDRRSAIIFALSAVGYGLLLGIVSGIFLFDPGSALSKVYGVQVPSLTPVVCCGSFGQMPQVVAYVTENFAVLITPLNLGILIMVSWLVGLNASIASKAFSQKRRMSRAGWAGGLGAFVGLFAICPTCAGFSLLTLLSLGGSVGLPLATSWMQLVLVIATVPVLAATPFVLLRQMSRAMCKLENANHQIQ